MDNKYFNGELFFKTSYESYLISKLGNVLSLKQKQPHILKPTSAVGYLRVNLMCGGVRVTKPIHKLMSEVFELRGVGDTIDHIDKDTTNNTLGNLRYATRKAQASNRRKHKNQASVLTYDEYLQLFDMYYTSGFSQYKLALWANRVFHRASSVSVYSFILKGKSYKKYYATLPQELKDEVQRLSDARNSNLHKRGNSK